jgi:Tfp pilus assembly protein PilW
MHGVVVGLIIVSAVVSLVFMTWMFRTLRHAEAEIARG